MLRIGDRAVLDRLVEHLVQQGYSRHDIFIQPRMGEAQPDVVLVDPRTRAPIAVVEVNDRLEDPGDVGAAGADLLEAVEGQEGQVRLFIAQQEGERFGFLEIIPHPKGGLWSFSSERVDEFPRSPAVVEGARASVLAAVSKERRRTFDGFKAACWGLALLTLLVGVADATGRFELSPTRLALLGVVIALVVIPFAGKLKVLGVEFERLQKLERESHAGASED